MTITWDYQFQKPYSLLWTWQSLRAGIYTEIYHVSVISIVRKAKSFGTTKRRLSPKILELMRQRVAARAAGSHDV
ncbi:hypothetical protein NECAME_11292 [Necator americanus]|uniref:Uncharacterized protein n=1 Tax=Necator americanus TaxID=51031 RepID=W2T4Y5_NECAM|nr:hypothetical protein NECAME_11292 [Necator americanus]ETN77090.1 hypothetical protein NECAME_11292 [Necator americanus]